MVRFSVTMDDNLAGSIDTSCAKKNVSRSDWINEACTTFLEGGSGSGTPLCRTCPEPGIP